MLTSLRAVLRSAARTLGVERAVHAAMIEEMWADVVGPAAARHSRVRGIRGTVLLAETEAGPWIQDLSAQRGRYLEEINRRLGTRVVTEIRFRQSTDTFSGDQPDAGETPRPADVQGGPNAAGDEPVLSPEEMAAVERAASEIRDPEIQEGARRAMTSQLKWRKRHDSGGEGQ